MRLENRAFRGTTLEEHRRQKGLRRRLVPFDSLEITIEQHALVSGMLVYQT